MVSISLLYEVFNSSKIMTDVESWAPDRWLQQRAGLGWSSPHIQVTSVSPISRARMRTRYT